MDGRLVNGRVDEKILAEVLEVAVHAGAAPHGCNAFKGLFSLNGRVSILRLRSRDSPVYMNLRKRRTVLREMPSRMTTELLSPEYLTSAPRKAFFRTGLAIDNTH